MTTSNHKKYYMLIFIPLILLAIAIVYFINESSYSNQQEKFQDAFEKYLSSQSETEVIRFPSGAEIKPFAWADKENETYYPRIVVTSYAMPDEYYTQDFAIIKTDLKYLADIFIDFASEYELKNDYYLYVQFCTTVGVMYDYEQDTLYKSSNFDAFMDLYNTFGTMSVDDVLDMSGGEEYLVDHEFGMIKHKVFEYNYSKVSPSCLCVVIYNDGKFNISSDNIRID